MSLHASQKTREKSTKLPGGSFHLRAEQPAARRGACSVRAAPAALRVCMSSWACSSPDYPAPSHGLRYRLPRAGVWAQPPGPRFPDLCLVLQEEAGKNDPC